MPYFQDIIGAEIAFGAESEVDALLEGGQAPDADLVGGAHDIFAGDPSIFAGSYPIVGAMSRAQENKNAMLRQLAARHAAAVMPRPITKGREYPLGFPTTVLAAGSTTNVSTQPQVPFRGRRLIVPSDIAGSILINDLKIGKNSMFAASGPVPARTFTEFGVGVDLNLDTAQISQQISLNITNTSGASLNFNATLIGTAVE